MQSVLDFVILSPLAEIEQLNSVNPKFALKSLFKLIKGIAESEDVKFQHGVQKDTTNF